MILDAGSEIGHVWGSRWDSLTLFTPAQYSGLPGLAFLADGHVRIEDDVIAARIAPQAAADKVVIGEDVPPHLTPRGSASSRSVPSSSTASRSR